MNLQPKAMGMPSLSRRWDTVLVYVRSVRAPHASNHKGRLAVKDWLLGR